MQRQDHGGVAAAGVTRLTGRKRDHPPVSSGLIQIMGHMSRSARQLAEQAGAVARDLRPRLRGWLHLVAFPVATVAGAVLMALAPTTRAFAVAAIYTATSSLLFGTSALYHRGGLSGTPRRVLKRLDHSNIYLIIAGTYTPFAALALHGAARAAVLATVWTGAVCGLMFRMLWIDAPRWLYTPLYIALGWVAIGVLPGLVRGAGVPATVLVVAGGCLYTAGGVVYALKRPNPSARWFGFHEVFHLFTVVAWVTQYVAVSFVTYRAG
jgi:hemolysin III